MKNKETVIVNDIKYIIKNKEDIIQKTLLSGRQWNNNIVLTIGHLIKKYNLKHLVNIGCHIGTVALPISKYIKKVTAIEAFQPTFEHLQEHIKINKISNIESYNFAIGEKEETVYFLDPENERIINNSGGMHAVTESDIKENRLSSKIHNKKYSNLIKRFDDLLVQEFDIVLIDVEGREYDVLKGAKKKIIQNMPILIIEIWNNYKRKKENMKTSQEDVSNYIISFGYKLLNKSSNDFIFVPKDMNI